MPVGQDLILILVVILIVLLFWRGPKVLPKLGESLGQSITGFRRATRDGEASPDQTAETADNVNAATSSATETAGPPQVVPGASAAPSTPPSPSSPPMAPGAPPVEPPAPVDPAASPPGAQPRP